MLAIYGKLKTDKKFKIYGDGSLQNNVMYGEFFPDSDKEALSEHIKKIMIMNPEYIFEIRSRSDNMV